MPRTLLEVSLSGPKSTGAILLKIGETPEAAQEGVESVSTIEHLLDGLEVEYKAFNGNWDRIKESAILAYNSGEEVKVSFTEREGIRIDFNFKK